MPARYQDRLWVLVDLELSYGIETVARGSWREEG